MKKRILAIAIATTMTMSCVGCGDNKADNTIHDIETESVIEIATETESATELTTEPQDVTAAELAPLAETGVITGVEDIKVQENTEVDLNELVYVDNTIVKSVDIDDSGVDYTKAGVYEVIYTITFDKTALCEYLDNNNVSVSFDTDTDSDTIIVKTTVTVEIVTEAEATETIANGEETVVTESTKEDVKTDNQSKANENAVESKPSETKPVDKTDKSDSKADTDTEKPADSKTDSNANTSEEKEPVKQPTQSEETQTDKSENKPSQNTEKPADNKPTETPAESKPVHTHSYTSKVTKNATCTEKGVKTYTCNCGDSYTESIAKTAHKYDNGTITKNPTCNTDGVKTYKCKTCDATYTEKIGVGSHTYAHHDAEYKTVTVVVQEAWDEPIEEYHTFCNQCGKDFGTSNAGVDAALEHTMMDFFDDCDNYSTYPVTVGTKHHDAVTETRQELVREAYDECTTCGHKK